MQQVYEIPHPNLKTSIKYKILSPAEVEVIHTDLAYVSTDAYMRTVLESVIPNLQKEITEELRKISREKAKLILMSLFHGCIMLNPGLDIESWMKLSISTNTTDNAARAARRAPAKRKTKKITRTQFFGLERHLTDRVIGQDIAIHEVVNALKRSQVGLNDERRPLGVFLFAGSSGVGKTHLARELHSYLYGSDHDLVRIDCGEYQHKHENAKLIGAPPGYLGYDEGGGLTNSMKKNPNTVVLLDEVEKAHPDIWNTFLRVFDEGMITDGTGKEVSFRDSIIIMTTNLGNRDVVNDLLARAVGFGKIDGSLADIPNRERVERLAQEGIRKNFSPEFLNRLDKTIVFNHLTKDDFEKISELELGEINTKLSKKGFSLAFDDAVIAEMVNDGMSSVQGARRLSQIRRDKIEDKLADCLLGARYPRGTIFQLTMQETGFLITAQKTKKTILTGEVKL